MKNNPVGNIGDAFNRSSYGSLVDLVGGLGWKAVGMMIYHHYLVASDIRHGVKKTV